jgi:hypothetical protein
LGSEITVRRLSLFATFVACIVACGCGDLCDYAVVSETKSPDGKLKAVVFDRGCGTPIDSSEQVSILSSSASSPSDRGNAFIVGDENHAVPTEAKLQIEIKVNWESNTSLSVSYPKNAQVSLKKPTVAGVSIRYVLTP